MVYVLRYAVLRTVEELLPIITLGENDVVCRLRAILNHYYILVLAEEEPK